MTSRSAADLVAQLALQPHPEGGWYREIYRSLTRVETSRGPRASLTTIYYLLESNQLSRWHVVQAARSLGDYSLVGCTVGPGFEFADFEFVAALPSHADHFKGDLAPYAGLR